MKVRSINEAWKMISERTKDADFVKDEDSSSRAGYPIYRARGNYYLYVCDLNARLELNQPDGSSENFYIDDPILVEDLHTVAEIIGDFIYQVDDKVPHKLMKETRLDVIRNLTHQVWEILGKLADENLDEDKAKKFKKDYCID